MHRGWLSSIVFALVIAAVLGRAGVATANCPSGHVCYEGGRVLTNPAIYIVYWGYQNDPDAPGEKAALEDLLYGISGTQYWRTMTQYYQDPPLVPFQNPPAATVWDATHVWVDDVNDLGHVYNPYGYNAQTQRTYLEDEVVRAYDHFFPNNPNPNPLILVMRPSSAYGDCCGFHSWAKKGITLIPYAAIRILYDANDPTPNGNGCYCNNATTWLENFTSVVAHELAEAITDPDLLAGPGMNGWIGSQEIADFCEQMPYTIELQTQNGPANIAVSGLLSNAADNGNAACVVTGEEHQERLFTGRDGQLWYEYAESDAASVAWTPKGTPDNVTLVATAPAVVSPRPGVVLAFIGDDQARLWMARWDVPLSQPVWSLVSLPAVSPNGYFLIDRPDAVATSPTRVDLFAVLCDKGNCGDRRLWHTSFDDASGQGAWHDWGKPPVPGIVSISPPGAAAASAGRIDVIVNDNDGPTSFPIWHGWSIDGGTSHTWENWGEPNDLNGAYLDFWGPDLISIEQNELEGVAIDSIGDVHHVHATCTVNGGCTATWDASWGRPPGIPARTMPSAIAVAPTLVGIGDHRFEVFLLGPGNGPNSDDELYTLMVDDGTPGMWSMGIATGVMSLPYGAAGATTW